jgi:uncharacterized protein (TIRG00374 family)
VKRSHILTVLKLLVAAGLIAWVISAAGWDNIKNALSNIDRQGWINGLSLVLLANCLSMLRWHILMRSVGLHSTPWLALRLGFIGVFFNNVVPGLTGGDLVKAIYVTRENPDQRAAAVVSVIVDRIVGIVALALIAAVVIPLDLNLYGEAAIGIYGFLGAAGLGAAVALSRRAKASLRGVLGRFGRKGDKGDGPSTLSKIDQAVSMYRDRMGLLAGALAMSFVVHLLIICALFLFGNAMASGGQEAIAANAPAIAGNPEAQQAAVAEYQELSNLQSVPLVGYCSIVPIIMIISALPIAPAGWGVGEAMFVYFFSTVGVADKLAVALSLTYRITVLLVSLIGGLMLVLDRKRVMEAAAEEAGGEDGSDPPGSGASPEA